MMTVAKERPHAGRFRINEVAAARGDRRLSAARVVRQQRLVLQRLDESVRPVRETGLGDAAREDDAVGWRRGSARPTIGRARTCLHTPRNGRETVGLAKPRRRPTCALPVLLAVVLSIGQPAAGSYRGYTGNVKLSIDNTPKDRKVPNEELASLSTCDHSIACWSTD